MRNKKAQKSFRTAAAVQPAKMSAADAARAKLVGVGVPGMLLGMRVRSKDLVIKKKNGTNRRCTKQTEAHSFAQGVSKKDVVRNHNV